MFDEERVARKYYSANTELDNSREAIILFFVESFKVYIYPTYCIGRPTLD